MASTGGCSVFTASPNHWWNKANGSLGAWASPQSRVIRDREELQDLLKATEQRFSDTQPDCPEHWGGYRLLPERIEFWQGRASRLHDRLNYRLQAGDWTRERLAP